MLLTSNCYCTVANCYCYCTDLAPILHRSSTDDCQKNCRSWIRKCRSCILHYFFAASCDQPSNTVRSTKWSKNRKHHRQPYLQYTVVSQIEWLSVASLLPPFLPFHPPPSPFPPSRTLTSPTYVEPRANTITTTQCECHLNVKLNGRVA